MTEGKEYAEAFRQLNQMIDEGRSWSGYERNRCFLNTGDSRFANVSATTGLDFMDDARTTASVDWDGDGDLDLFQVNRTSPQVRFLENLWGHRSPSLALRLEGVTCNRDAIGARVELFRKGVAHRDIRTLRAGNGFLSQSSKWLHFGLGDSNNPIQKVEVHWPDGKVESFTNLTAGRYRLVQGAGVARRDEGQAIRIPTSEHKLSLPEEQEQAAVWLSSALPLPPLPYRDANGAGQTLKYHDGPVLLQLWASWCPRCATELTEMMAHRDEFESLGLRIVAMSVDGIGDDQTTEQDAWQAVNDRKYAFEHGAADADLLRFLEVLRAELFSNSRPFPVPTSFLINRDGELVAIYVGAPGVNRVKQDVNRLPTSPEAQRALSIPVGGRWLAPPAPLRFSPIAVALANSELPAAARWYERLAAPQRGLSHCGLGAEAERSGDIQAAKAHYEQAIREAPNEAKIYHLVAGFLVRQRNPKQATTLWQRAIQLAPDNAEYHFNFASAQLILQQPAIAERSYRRVIEIDPKSARAHTAIARLLQQRNAWDESLPHLKSAIEVAPEFEAAYVYLAQLLIRRGQLPQAEASLQRALQLKPTLIDAEIQLANVLAAQQKTAQAIQRYRKILKRAPDTQSAKLNLAWCLATCADQELRSGKEALQLAKEAAVKTNRSSVRVLEVLAAAFAESGDFAAAIGVTDEAIRKARQNPRQVARLREHRQKLERREPIRSP